GPSQMSYDLRCLRLHGLIQRLAHSNTYTVTPNGIRVAVFYTKLHGRLLAPLLAADRPPATLEMRRALATIDRTIADCVANSLLVPGPEAWGVPGLVAALASRQRRAARQGAPDADGRALRPPGAGIRHGEGNPGDRLHSRGAQAPHRGGVPPGACGRPGSVP